MQINKTRLQLRQGTKKLLTLFLSYLSLLTILSEVINTSLFLAVVYNLW